MMKDYHYYMKFVYFEVTISTTDLYKYEYNQSGEYAPVRFYDYETHVARISEDAYDSRDIEIAFGSMYNDITSPSGSRTINVDSYRYSYTVTKTYKVVKRTRTYDVEVKDEEGNVIGTEQKTEEYAATELIATSSDEIENRYDAYAELEDNRKYFVVFLTPREKGGDYESFTYYSGGVQYCRFFTLTFPL